MPDRPSNAISGSEWTSNQPLVTPGADTHPTQGQALPEGVFIGLDWIRQKAPESDRRTHEAQLDSHWPGPPNYVKPAWHFGKTLMWPNGPQLSWDHPSQICVIDLPSRALALMDGHERVTWLKTLADLGTTPTRIDVAIDFVDASIALGRQKQAACERGELCGLRTWHTHHEYGAFGQQVRFQLSLGSGGSSMYVRVYDKGLEQRTRELGHQNP